MAKRLADRHTLMPNYHRLDLIAYAIDGDVWRTLRLTEEEQGLVAIVLRLKHAIQV